MASVRLALAALLAIVIQASASDVFCGQNERRVECAPVCDRTCGKLDEKPVYANLCNAGCVCVQGYAWLNGKCVPEKECGDHPQQVTAPPKDNHNCTANACQNGGTCVETPQGAMCICYPGVTGQHCENVECNADGIAITASPHLTRAGRLTSPKEGNTYPRNTTCKWQIWGSGGLWVWTIPYYTDIRGCDEECSCGYLKFTDIHGNVLGKFCEEKPMDDDSIIYTNDPMEVEFYSSGADTKGKRGFEIYHHQATNDCYDVDYQGLTPGEYLCNNGAFCYPMGDEMYPDCRCRYGYIGEMCQYKDLCLFSPCQNGGTCNTSYYNGKLTCKCPAGFAGVRCEKKL